MADNHLVEVVVAVVEGSRVEAWVVEAGIHLVVVVGAIVARDEGVQAQVVVGNLHGVVRWVVVVEERFVGTQTAIEVVAEEVQAEA